MLRRESYSRRCFVRAPPLPPGHKPNFARGKIHQSEGGQGGKAVDIKFSFGYIQLTSNRLFINSIAELCIALLILVD
jgi:hypothetical protein